jgi:hypothetical protein
MLKTVSSITNAIGALNYKGTWNASTNTPTLASGAGTKGDYYQVSAAGSTSLDGLSNWGVGDVAAFNGITWQRIEGGADLNGVNLTVSQLTALLGNTYVGSSSTVIGNSERFGVYGSQTAGGAALTYIYNSANSGADASSCLALYKEMTTTTSDARFMQFYAAGIATPMGGIVGNGASNVQFASISDIREKKNIAPISGSLPKVLALNPVGFDWIANGEHCPAGFVAQEVEQVFPEFVVENMASENEQPRKGLTGGLTSGIVAHLVKAIQEQQVQIETIKAELATLKGA